MIKELKPIDFKTKKITKALFTFICLFIIEAFLMGIIATFIKNQIIINSLVYIFITLFIFIFNKNKLIKEFKNIKKDIKNNYKNILLVFIICLILEFILNSILIKLLGTNPNNNNYIVDTYKNSNIFFIILDLFILGPIAEELLYLYPFNNVNNKKLAFILYSLIFALAHVVVSNNLIELLFFFPYIFMSIGFNYAYYKTNNIYVSIMLHSINNIISYMLLFI